MKVSARIAIPAVLGSLILGGCAHYFTLARQDIDVILQVVGNPQELKVTSPGNGNCKPQNRGNGCVYVGKNDTAKIRFRLNSSPDWYLKTFKICKGNTKAGQDCSLDIWDRLEFTATTDSQTTLLLPGADGVIDISALSASNLDEFLLFDQNLFEQDWFYSVQVCNTDVTVDCLWTDPPLENRGKGH